MIKKISFIEETFKTSEYSELTNITKEEKKVYKLTQINTLINRDMLDKREIYLKKAKAEYKDIYGNKGVKYCNDMQRKFKIKPQKNNKVKFSNSIQYSINLL